MITSFPEKIPPVAGTAPVIVIGSGIAGLYAALELSKTGPVLLLTKTVLAESNTTYAQGGIAAAMGALDSPELHYQDTMMAGAGLCEPEAVRTLVYDGPKRVQHLLDIGVPFDQNGGEISFTREAAHSRRRILHADGDATGRAISRTLVACVKASSAIQILEHHFALALITAAGRCAGVVTIHQGQLYTWLSSTIILATGGIGQLFGKTTNPAIATGDGMALAANGGAVLRDLEFIQFHPTALHLPPAPPFLISESVRGEGAILLNDFGVRFMPGYHSLAELAPRDIVARSIFAEIEKTGATSVYLDLSKMPPATIKTRFPNIYETCLRYGLDITQNPIPVAPAAHYMMGGVQTDLFGRTSIPGLFAAGEVADTGVHGANRLASNSLLEGLVFGGRIADHIKSLPQTKTPNLSESLTIHYPQIITSFANREVDLHHLHQITDHYLGILRNAIGLQTALTQLNTLPEPQTEFELEPAFFELQNLYHLAKMMVHAALTRTESRGGHYRSDFPNPDNAWRKHIDFKGSNLDLLKIK